MKTTRTRISVIVLTSMAAFASPLLADSAFEVEFQQLTEQHEKALAAAADPIRRRYQASLEQLLRHATQANDLKAAVKIKDALKTLGWTQAITAPPATSDALKKLLIGTTWHISRQLNGTPVETVTFQDNGKYQRKDGTTSQWTATGNSVVTLTSGRANFSETYDTFEIEGAPAGKLFGRIAK